MKTLIGVIALLFLLPGLAGLTANAMLQTRYFETSPRMPQAGELQTVPREMNGQTVYLTAEEDEQLDWLRHYGLRGFGIGAVLGLLYLGAMATHLERWHSTEEHDL